MVSITNTCLHRSWLFPFALSTLLCWIVTTTTADAAFLGTSSNKALKTKNTIGNAFSHPTSRQMEQESRDAMASARGLPNNTHRSRIRNRLFSQRNILANDNDDSSYDEIADCDVTSPESCNLSRFNFVDNFVKSPKTRRDILLQGSFSLAGVITSGLLKTNAAEAVEAASAAMIAPASSDTRNTNPFQLKSTEIPFSSRRKYKTITLPNGLQVLLVSDKKAFGASAALTIGGAGQFSDPVELPGLAHLMEHMVLSYTSDNSRHAEMFRQKSSSESDGDFEAWLNEYDGMSNGFTAYDMVCYHFNVESDDVFPAALERFARLFNQNEVVKTCGTDEILKREVRRVDSELDYADELTQAKYYLGKKMFAESHPYSHFGAGNIDTLEKIPSAAGIDVGNSLVQFFKEKYQARNAVLTVVSPSDLNQLERMVSPFATTMSRDRVSPDELTQLKKFNFPKTLQIDNKKKQMIVYRSSKDDTKQTENLEKVSLEWVLDLDYSTCDETIAGGGPNNKKCITASQIGFVLSQRLGRRGPGSLYAFMTKRGWVPSNFQGLPRISFPVDVSGFQVMKLELTITQKGFVNRSAVIASIYNLLRNDNGSLTSGAGLNSNFVISRELIAQCSTVAQLHGHVLAPRPPDAIELAVDGQHFGIDLSDGVGSGKWFRFPEPTDRSAILALEKSVKDTLTFMADPSNAVIVATATDKTLALAKKENLFENNCPPVSSTYWKREPISGAKFCKEDFSQLTGRLEQWWFAAIPEEDELMPPRPNPLIPLSLRSARLEAFAKNMMSQSQNKEIGYVGYAGTVGNYNLFQEEISTMGNDYWKISDISTASAYLPVPRTAPEPSCRCALVLQLMSPRPVRANVKKGAHGLVWKKSVERAVRDLAEAGSPAGLAYDVSFNKFGMRLCFLGISQNLPAYCRRFANRLVEHHNELLAGPENVDQQLLDASLFEVSKAPYITPQRKKQLLTALQSATNYDAAIEGIAFFKSCNGAVCLSQGDLLRSEVKDLSTELETIFKRAVGSKTRPMLSVPDVDDILYPPQWKPRSTVTCTISGSNLIADTCGRVPR